MFLRFIYLIVKNLVRFMFKVKILSVLLAKGFAEIKVLEWHCINKIRDLFIHYHNYFEKFLLIRYLKIIICFVYFNKGYFRKSIWAAVAFMTFLFEVFLCTFHARLPYFCKSDNFGFVYFRIFQSRFTQSLDVSRIFLYETLCAIWYRFYNLRNVKNTHGGVILLVACDFTTSITPP